MRFSFGLPETASVQELKLTGWQAFAAPALDTRFFVILSASGAAVFIGGIALWAWLVPNAWAGSFVEAFPPGTFLAGAAITLFVHEVLHLIWHPGMGLTSRSIIGFWPQKLAPYVYYDGVLSRNRHLSVSLAPFLGLTVLPLLLAASGKYSNSLLALASITKAAFSMADLYFAFLIVTGLPGNALVRGGSSNLWWRAASNDQSEKLLG